MRKYSDKLNKLSIKKEAIEEQVTALRKELACRKKEQVYLTDALDVLQTLAKEIQQKAHNQIASLVSRCLQAVFDDPYELKISFVKRRKRTEAVMQFMRRGRTIDPLAASSDGVVDVAGFALRLACLVLARPSRRKLMILDEPFVHVRTDRQERVKDLLEALSEELDVQFIIVTHIETFKIGTVIDMPTGAVLTRGRS